MSAYADDSFKVGDLKIRMNQVAKLTDQSLDPLSSFSHSYVAPPRK